MKHENDAREQIVKNWKSYPAGGRQRCVNTTGYMPSYVEWLTWLPPSSRNVLGCKTRDRLFFGVARRIISVRS